MVRKGTSQEVQAESQEAAAVDTAAISPEVLGVLNQVGREIAQKSLAPELEAHVMQWVRDILNPHLPEHWEARDALIRNVTTAMAGKILFQCVTGAIADVKQASLPATASSEVA